MNIENYIPDRDTIFPNFSVIYLEGNLANEYQTIYSTNIRKKDKNGTYYKLHVLELYNGPNQSIHLLKRFLKSSYMVEKFGIVDKKLIMNFGRDELYAIKDYNQESEEDRLKRLFI